jgi:hypothetical protein
MVFKQFYQTKEGFFLECITKNKTHLCKERKRKNSSPVKEANNG